VTTDHLAEKMRAVREGDLDVMVTVRNLDTFGQLASDFNRMVAGLRQRDRIRETFGRYVSQEVATDILAGNISLGGELRTATVLFSDIRGFTQMSERMTPEEVVNVLNRYLNVMIPCIFSHGGVPDKLIGDAIMAIWGVPVGSGSKADDAQAAVACARSMSHALDELNAMLEQEGKLALEVGIGIHTGPVVAGNIGSERFMQYTVIGDTVNVTSRIEGMSKILGHRIVISEQTAALLGDAAGKYLEEVNEMNVRGREMGVRVFGLR